MLSGSGTKYGILLAAGAAGGGGAAFLVFGDGKNPLLS